MRFDPQSGFMPGTGENAPLPGLKRGKSKGERPRGRLRPGVIIIVLAVTGVLGVWMWREHVYGPQTASADQFMQYLPDWLKQSLDLEDANEETTVLPVSTPDDAPPGVRRSADGAGPGGDDAPPADSATSTAAEAGSSEQPPLPQAVPAAEQPRKHITLGPSDNDDAEADDAEAGQQDGSYGLTFQPPYRAKQAFEKGMARQYYGRHREAVVHFERAIEIDPEFAEARYRLALSLLKIDDIAGAREQHTELVKLNARLAGQLAQQLP